MLNLAVLTPTKNRHAICKEMLESFAETFTCSFNVKFYFALSKNEEHIEEYKKLFNETPFKSIAYLHPDWTTTMSFNMLARSAKSADLFMMIGDDIKLLTKGWDAEVLKRYNELKNKVHVFNLQEQRDERGVVPIITREFYDALGYLISPIFIHWFTDTWLLEMAEVNGCLSQLEEFKARHDKNNPEGQNKYGTSTEQRNAWLDRDHMVDNTCKHFLKADIEKLDKALCVGNIDRMFGEP